MRLISFFLFFIAAPALASPGLACRQALARVEREAALPPGLLHAIGLVESGRGEAGIPSPWPWTLRANGRGMYFDSREEAARELARLTGAGVTLVDVGCLQVNLHFHGEAFREPVEALDPLANARYAARFLTRLHDELGGWEAAVAAYHSRRAARGEAYLARVIAAWPGGETVAQLALAPIPPPPAAPPVLLEVAEAPIRP